ncbi:MAG: RNA-binding protein [Gammaproteobacteria bacterium]|jgi:RNA recognition motif-containing protein|nr:RNA-binding protein [Gammaproteobacteria bacterium]
MKMYVGNLPWSVTTADLEEMFSPFGEVTSATLISDRETGRSRGFGFVEMSEEDATRAMADLDGKDMKGRPLRVSQAQERQPRSGGGFGGGGRGGGGRGGGGGGRGGGGGGGGGGQRY